MERRNLLAADFPQFVDPHPAPGNRFGDTVVPLSTGNIVITSPFDDAGGNDAGAVYLFNGATGALISTLTGSTAKDRVGIGGVTALANGNYVVHTPEWTNLSAANAGAVTFGNGISGISGVVSATNSLVGGTTNDAVGRISTVLALSNGNYVVTSPDWDNGSAADAGAVTFGNGTSGISGVVSAANSLVGSKADDSVGSLGVVALTNGNYVVRSPGWNNGAATDAGAVTFGNGDSGISGVVGAANSLVGSRVNDRVGNHEVIRLTGGGYVVRSPSWDRRFVRAGLETVTPNVGAVTFGNGTTGVQGAVSSANSLIGGTAEDQIGSEGVTALTNGNYVVASSRWDNDTTADAGAATFGSGATGIQGLVSSANSLVGSRASDGVSSGGVTALANGNYVVRSPSWDRPVLVGFEAVFIDDVGAATFGSGATGISGAITANNSLVGGRAFDQVNGAVTALTNGNYVVSSPFWDADNGTTHDAGAVTFGNGSTGISGVISAANSLIGRQDGDQIGVLGNGGVFDGDPRGVGGVTALANGNYVVSSTLWDGGSIENVGAVTFGNGTTGIVGHISSSNSLTGLLRNDYVGYFVTALANGNYVVKSPFWNNGAASDAGAATFGSGSSGVSGVASDANSLVGDSTGDGIGMLTTALTNGSYVVTRASWDNGAATDAGAATFGDGTSGISGVVSAANSLVGATTNDMVGGFAYSLTNGNYVVVSPNWRNGAITNAGAMTFGDGVTGVRGLINSLNSAVGAATNAGLLRSRTLDNHNSPFFGRFVSEAGGIIRVGSQENGFNGSSMIASFGGDQNYTENADPISISDTAAISEVDYAALAGLTLTISLTAGGQVSDRLGIRTLGTGPGEINVQGNEVRIGDIVLGTFTGGGDGTTPLVIALGSDATTPRVQSLLRNINFSNVSDDPPTAARSLQVIFSDDQGLASAALTKQINVTAVNDAPVLDNSVNQTLRACREDATAPASSDVASLWTTGVTDPDGLWRGIAVTSASSFNGTWQYKLSGASTWAGMGAVSNSAALLLPGWAKIRFLPKPNFNGVVSMRYRAWDGTGPNAAGDKVDTAGNTGGSTPFSIAQDSASLTVTPVNDKPVLSLSGTIGYVHDKPAVTLAPFARVADIDSENFAGGRLRVRITDGASTSNRLAIGAGFAIDASGNVLQGTTIIGKRVSNGFGTKELIVTFNTNAIPARVQELVRAITFKTVGGAAGPRKVVFTVSDGDGGLSAEETTTVTVS